MKTAAAEIVFPLAIIIDSREQLPYSFSDLQSDADTKRLPLKITTEVRGIPSGDYSLDGFESSIAIERKSVNDLFSTLGQGRARFQRELQRLAAMKFAAVVVEAEWSEMLLSPPPFTKLSPKSIFRSVLAWQQRYPNVHWLMLPGRRVAERATFRILQRFYTEDLKRKGAL